MFLLRLATDPRTCAPLTPVLLQLDLRMVRHVERERTIVGIQQPHAGMAYIERTASSNRRARPLVFRSGWRADGDDEFVGSWIYDFLQKLVIMHVRHARGVKQYCTMLT
jgi:hypothetical protein